MIRLASLPIECVVLSDYSVYLRYCLIFLKELGIQSQFKVHGCLAPYRFLSLSIPAAYITLICVATKLQVGSIRMLKEDC